MGEDLARAFISFFAIVDPIGNVTVFYLLARPFTVSRRLQVAAVAVGTAFGLLALFAFAGREVLDFMGISVDSFKVAAGFLLLPTAYRLVERGQSIDVTDEGELDPVQLAMAPLATPLIAGPGALATAISLSDTLGRTPTVLGMGLVLLLSFVAFAAGAWLFQALGTSLLRLLSRMMGILLVAIAADFILDGLSATF